MKGRQGLLRWRWFKAKWLLESASNSAPLHVQLVKTTPKYTRPGLWPLRIGTWPAAVALKAWALDQQHRHHPGLVRNRGSQSPHQTDWIRNSGVGPAVCVSTSPPGGYDACWSLTALTVTRTETMSTVSLPFPFFTFDSIIHKTPQSQILQGGTHESTYTPTPQWNYFLPFLFLDLLVMLFIL